MRRKLNIGKNTRVVKIELELEINAELDNDELKFVVKRISQAIKTQEKPCGFMFRALSAIPFLPFKMKVAGVEVECKGDKAKTEEKILNSKQY